MVKKLEAKKKIEELFEVWKAEEEIKPQGPNNFMEASDFINWLRKSPYSELMKFRATMGVEWCIENWFDTYFKQSWRN